MGRFAYAMDAIGGTEPERWVGTYTRVEGKELSCP